MSVVPIGRPAAASSRWLRSSDCCATVRQTVLCALVAALALTVGSTRCNAADESRSRGIGWSTPPAPRLMRPADPATADTGDRIDRVVASAAGESSSGSGAGNGTDTPQAPTERDYWNGAMMGIVIIITLCFCIGSVVACFCHGDGPRGTSEGAQSTRRSSVTSLSDSMGPGNGAQPARAGRRASLATVRGGSNVRRRSHVGLGLDDGTFGAHGDVSVEMASLIDGGGDGSGGGSGGGGARALRPHGDTGAIAPAREGVDSGIDAARVQLSMSRESVIAHDQVRESALAAGLPPALVTELLSSHHRTSSGRPRSFGGTRSGSLL